VPIARQRSAAISMLATAAPCPFNLPIHRPFAGRALRVCPRGGCARHPSSIHLIFLVLMRTSMRDLIHLWKFQNRPQLTDLLAELLLGGLHTERTETLTTSTSATHTVLVPIPTQWRRQVRRGFDHTWLLANAIRSQWAQPAIVRPWLRNRH